MTGFQAEVSLPLGKTSLGREPFADQIFIALIYKILSLKCFGAIIQSGKILAAGDYSSAVVYVARGAIEKISLY